MKTYKLTAEVNDLIQKSKENTYQLEINNLKLKLNLAQIQITLLRNDAKIEINKAQEEGIIKGFAAAKKLDINTVKLSEDGLSIVQDGEHNN